MAPVGKYALCLEPFHPGSAGFFRGAGSWLLAALRSGIRFDQQIEIPGETWLGVKDDRVSSHNEVLNAMGMECGGRSFAILEHPALSSDL